MSLYIYILQLEENKYYVGKTKHPKFRLESHFNAEGSEWTKKYKPIEVVKIIEDCDEFDEDKYTLMYMSLYGIDNVRGGSFCSTIINKKNLKIIDNMIAGLSKEDVRCCICLLRLEDSKYYIMKVKDKNFRLDQYIHVDEWTKKYKPIEILKILERCDSFDVNKYTLKCMQLCGIDNVRGGSFMLEKLSKTTISFINNMLDSCSDLCHICKLKGHFSKDCGNIDKSKLLDQCNNLSETKNTDEYNYEQEDYEFEMMEKYGEPNHIPEYDQNARELIKNVEIIVTLFCKDNNYSITEEKLFRIMDDYLNKYDEHIVSSNKIIQRYDQWKDSGGGVDIIRDHDTGYITNMGSYKSLRFFTTAIAKDKIKRKKELEREHYDTSMDLIGSGCTDCKCFNKYNTYISNISFLKCIIRIAYHDQNGSKKYSRYCISCGKDCRTANNKHKNYAYQHITAYSIDNHMCFENLIIQESKDVFSIATINMYDGIFCYAHFGLCYDCDDITDDCSEIYFCEEGIKFSIDRFK